MGSPVGDAATTLPRVALIAASRAKATAASVTPTSGTMRRAATSPSVAAQRPARAVLGERAAAPRAARRSTATGRGRRGRTRAHAAGARSCARRRPAPRRAASAGLGRRGARTATATGRTSKRCSPNRSLAHAFTTASSSTWASSATRSPGRVRTCCHQSAPSSSTPPRIQRLSGSCRSRSSSPQARAAASSISRQEACPRSPWPARTRGASRRGTAGRGPWRCRPRSWPAAAHPAAPTRAWCRAADGRPPASACARRRGAAAGRPARTAARRAPGRRPPA